MSNEQTKVSHRDLRETFYRLRDFEISNLWQRSIFLSALLVLFFPAYGVLVSKLLESTSKHIIYHEICCALALCAIIFSIIWIMMAKGSKAWFEVYERKICEIEDEEDLGIMGDYSMQNMGKVPWSLDSRLLSGKAGRYSVSKLNILIGQFLFILWVIIFIIHWIGIISFLNMHDSCVFHTIILMVLLISVIVVIVTASMNTWAKSGCLQKP